MVFKAVNYLLARNSQRMFKDKEERKYYLRRKDDLQQPFVHTPQKSICISVCRVTLCVCCTGVK